MAKVTMFTPEFVHLEALLQPPLVSARSRSRPETSYSKQLNLLAYI